MKYAVYNAAGEILRVIQCRPSSAPGQPREGEFITDAPQDVDDLTHKVVDGEVVPK